MSPQTAIFGIVKGNDKSFLVQNMILMVFKLFINQGSAAHFNFNASLHQLVNTKNLERGAASNNKQKYDMFLKKWSIEENLLPQ